MPSRLKKFFLFFLAIFVLIAGFCGGTIINKKDYRAQASLWDAIRAWVAINPLEVVVSAPAEAEVEKTFKVTAKAINKGDKKIENAEGEIFLSEGLALLKKDPVQKIGIIQGGKSKTVSWTVKGIVAGEEGENFTVEVLVTGELERSLIKAESNTAAIEIKEFIEKPPRKWYQNIFDFFRDWFGGNE